MDTVLNSKMRASRDTIVMEWLSDIQIDRIIRTEIAMKNGTATKDDMEWYSSVANVCDTYRELQELRKNKEKLERSVIKWQKRYKASEENCKTLAEQLEKLLNPIEKKKASGQLRVIERGY